MELLKRLLFPVIMVLLAIGFWSSPQLQQIAAGVAIFLFGMLSLERGFQSFSGGLMEQLLQRFTRTTPRALSFGVISTTLMQSSSLVSVLTISFLSAGLINLMAGLGVIFGANLGTTTGAWLIAGFGLSINLAQLAMPMLVFGVMLLFQPNQTRAGIGHILAGIGFLFMGIDYMKEGFATLQSGLDLSSISPGGFTSLLLYTLFGAVATVVMQSSHATLVLTLTALAAGHVQYMDALALAVGANIGTTVTAILGALSANVAGKRLALGHLLFNLVTGAVALVFMPVLSWLVNESAGLLGISADNYTLKLALFHTLFNLLGVLIMVPRLSQLQAFLERKVPEREISRQQPQYLSQAALETPQAAVAVTRSESARLYRSAASVMIHGLGWEPEEFLRGQPLALLADHSRPGQRSDIQLSYEQEVKGLYSAIVSFISSAREKTSGRADEQLRELRAADHHLIQAIKGVKHLQRNLLQYLHSPNADMAGAYRHQREQIASVLRAIEDVRQTSDVLESRLALDHQMLLVEREREQSDSLVESLIRAHRITPEMATSLMTDKGYTQDVCNALLNAARYLFIDEQVPQAETPENLQLEKTDLSAISQKLDEQRDDSDRPANGV
ncbi:Na/Pi cotransporter family protein [Thalassolituus sp. LLYu03]|uniref:Na/Pi cotransporter family protein n=1 Tax=Thalassolituus sp. LLYu03 TaxID=3421656 RepID=UPI003D2A95D0